MSSSDVTLMACLPRGGVRWKARGGMHDQELHHRTVTFQEEFRKFLKGYGVEYDERHV